MFRRSRPTARPSCKRPWLLYTAQAVQCGTPDYFGGCSSHGCSGSSPCEATAPRHSSTAFGYDQRTSYQCRDPTGSDFYGCQDVIGLHWGAAGADGRLRGGPLSSFFAACWPPDTSARSRHRAEDSRREDICADVTAPSGTTGPQRSPPAHTRGSAATRHQGSQQGGQSSGGWSPGHQPHYETGAGQSRSHGRDAVNFSDAGYSCCSYLQPRGRRPRRRPSQPHVLSRAGQPLVATASEGDLSFPQDGGRHSLEATPRCWSLWERPSTSTVLSGNVPLLFLRVRSVSRSYAMLRRVTALYRLVA